MVPRGGTSFRFGAVRIHLLKVLFCLGLPGLSSSIVRWRALQSSSKCGTGCGTECRTDTMARLTERTVQNAKAGRHSDGDGLHLVVAATGRKKWVLRYQVRGVRRDKGLGSYPDVSLKEARSKASADRALIAKGVDPIEERRAAKKAAMPVPTFGDIAQIVIADAQSKSINAKVRYQWERHLGPVYSGPLLARPVHEITTLDVATVLQPIWRTKPEVARKLYPAIRRVFEHARILLRDEHRIAMPHNPARWEDLKAMGFEPPAKLSKGSHPSLPYPQVPAFMADLRGRDAVAAYALEFLILTNVRTDAVLKAAWDDLDLDHALWTVPLASLKDRKHRKEGFRVPLVTRAVEIVRQMSAGRTSRFVFPGQARGQPLSNMALLTLLKRMNSRNNRKWLDAVSRRPITAHGFRATFRTWAEEVATFPHTVIEQAMGHQVGTQVERAYRRTDVLDKRRELMTAWAEYCERRDANVIPIARA
jgi:integrase